MGVVWIATYQSRDTSYSACATLKLRGPLEYSQKCRHIIRKYRRNCKTTQREILQQYLDNENHVPWCKSVARTYCTCMVYCVKKSTYLPRNFYKCGESAPECTIFANSFIFFFWEGHNPLPRPQSLRDPIQKSRIRPHVAETIVTWLLETTSGWRFGLVVTRWLRST